MRPFIRPVRAALLAAVLAVTSLTLAASSASAFNASYCGGSYGAGTKCWHSTTTKHTWSFNRATHVGGTASSLCAYITSDTSLSFVASGSGCGSNISRYSVCYGTNNSAWLVFVEHFALGKNLTIQGYADTASFTDPYSNCL